MSENIYTTLTHKGELLINLFHSLVTSNFAYLYGGILREHPISLQCLDFMVTFGRKPLQIWITYLQKDLLCILLLS